MQGLGKGWPLCSSLVLPRACIIILSDMRTDKILHNQQIYNSVYFGSAIIKWVKHQCKDICFIKNTPAQVLGLYIGCGAVLCGIAACNGESYI